MRWLLLWLLVTSAPVLARGGDPVVAEEASKGSSLSAVARTSDSAGSATMQLVDLDGRWLLIESEGATQDRLASIDAAVEPLTWVVQKMASGVLRSTTAPRSTLHFVWDGERLHERVPGKNDKVEARSIEPGAEAFRAIDPRGEPFEGAWEWTSDGLRFRWRQHQAYGTNLYRMDRGKRTLTVDHTIHVTAIGGVRPIAYRSRFSKDALPAVSAAGEPVAR